MKKIALSALCLLAGPLVATDITLSDANNVEKTMIALGEGDRLLVPAPATAGGVCDIKARIRVTGAATLVLPTGTAYDDVILSGGLSSRNASGQVTEGRLTVTGGSILFGANKALNVLTDIDYPRFDCPLAFDAGCGVTFTNGVTLHRLQSADELPVTIAKGTILALRGKNVFTRFMENVDGESPSFTATTDYTVMAQDRECFPPNTVVTVKPGATFALKFCVDKSDGGERENFWQWAGCPSGEVRNIASIVLESEGETRSRLLDLCRKVMYLYADISGTGDFHHDGQPLSNEDRTYLRGACSFRGTVSIAGGNAAVYFAQATPGHADNAVVFQGRARLGFEAPPGGSLPTDVFIKSLTSADGGSQVWLYTGQTFTVDESRGNWAAVGQGPATRCHMVIGNLVSGTVSQGASLQLKILGRDAGSLQAMPYQAFHDAHLDLSECRGDWPLPITIQNGVRLTVTGDFVDGSLLLGGSGELVAVPDGMTVVPQSTNLTAHVQADAAVTVDTSLLATNWQRKVALWFDASKTETLHMYPEGICYTNGFPLIMSWGDCRTGIAGKYLHNGRSFANGTTNFGNRHDEVYPYVVTNGLNGLNYISMGSYGNSIDRTYEVPGYTGTTTERRRLLMISGPQGSHQRPEEYCSTAYAILVFGSQQGGGAAVLGAKDGVLERGTAVSSAFFKNRDVAMIVDGEAKAGKTTSPNGGWQILSLSLGGVGIEALGWNRSYENSGGQNYAEILLFSEMPTEDERKACENYLAKKWGLEASYAYHGSGAPVVDLQGKGTVTLTADAEMRGGFSGTVTVPEGVTLTVPRALPPGEEVVPSENRLVWFDPDLEGAAAPASSTDPRVGRLKPRDADGLTGGTDAMSGLSGGANRRPWAERVARGDGEVRTWLNFSNVVAGDTSGNTLRYQTTYSDSTASASIGAVREGFMVLDTTRGGGTPIGTEVGMSGTQRAHLGTNYADAVWATKNGALASVTTRLDNVVIDGLASGFKGCPEVLSFAFGTAWEPKFFGSYSAGEGTNSGIGNTEVIGESLFYSQPLTDAQRADVTAYLAYKWFGKVMKGYADLSRMTVAGAGRVEVSDVAHLPNFADGFSGAVVCTRKNYAFTLEPSVSRTAATNLLEMSVPLELARGTTLAVDCVGTLRSGLYKLIAGDVRLPGDEFPTLNLADVELGNYTTTLVKTTGGLFLSVQAPTGMQIIIR